MIPELGKVNFISKTSQEYFIKWLIKFTIETLPKEFPLGPGFIRLSFGGPEIHKGGDAFVLFISLIEKMDDGEEKIYYDEVPGIVFELTPLAEFNIEISAYYYLEELQTYYSDLLTEIQKRWPEIGDQIKAVWPVAAIGKQPTFIEDHHNKPGRKSYLLDIWARGEVYELGRDSSVVYNEWLEKRDPEAILLDPKRQFNKIMDPKHDFNVPLIGQKRR